MCPTLFIFLIPILTESDPLILMEKEKEKEKK
jgi:hypothetical protein